MTPVFIRWFEDIGAGDTGSVGGKNASLGEMVRNLGCYDIKVPTGFATTAEGYRHFLVANNLGPVIASSLAELKGGTASVAEVGSAIRAAILKAGCPEDLAGAIGQAYRDLSQRLGVDEADVAVRSSATAEDLPEASFAGQQESFLNIRGEAAVLDACRRCFASLFTDRAISYREAKGFDPGGVRALLLTLAGFAAILGLGLVTSGGRALAEMGQRYLVAGKRVSMRIWIDEPGGKLKGPLGHAIHH